MIKKKNKGLATLEICVVIILLCLLVGTILPQLFGGLNTPHVTLKPSIDVSKSYLLSNISCTKQKVKLYRNNECLVYTIDANSSYYIPANVVFDRIESEPVIDISDYVAPFGTKVVK